METRIKYTKTDKNGWCYAIQVKKWIFWKTVETYTTFEGAERFLNILKDVNNFNIKAKSLKKLVYEGWAVRNIYKNMDIGYSLNFFESYPSKCENDNKSKITWRGTNSSIRPTMEINVKNLFGKECLEPMRLRITIEQMEE